MALRSFGAALLIGLATLASGPSLAWPGVGNGKRIADTVIPEVVQIEWRKKTQAGVNGQATSYTVTSSLCTGTFVSATTLITAAHCVLDGKKAVDEVVIARGQGAGSRAADVRVHPKYASYPSAINPYDVALVVFREAVAAKSVGLLTRDALPQKGAKPGEAAVIVGYGFQDLFDLRSNVGKSVGFTNLVASEPMFMIFGHTTPRGRAADGSATGTGVEAINLEGDSGGPLFVDGYVAGISSILLGHKVRGKMEGRYTNLRRADIWRDFLETEAKRGALVKGINAEGGAIDLTTLEGDMRNALTEPNYPCYCARMPDDTCVLAMTATRRIVTRTAKPVAAAQVCDGKFCAETVSAQIIGESCGGPQGIHPKGAR